MTHQPPPNMPLVVQCGFAGSRRLLDAAMHPAVDETSFLCQVEEHLLARLQQLPADLGLSSRHFLCGISQVAIGADTIFTRVCKALSIPQRVFLPQARGEFLAAIGSGGGADFSPAERETALELLASPHVIEERVVSDAADRQWRFEDVNAEIVRVSDVLVCLLRADATGKPGGTYDLIARAASRNKPVLAIQIAVKDGKPDFQETWHWNRPPGADKEVRFTPPAWPHALADMEAAAVSGALPSAGEYCGALKKFAGEKAGERSAFFKTVALIIIGTHVLATLFAVIALQYHGPGVLPWLLGGELLLLATGFGVHQYLHHSQASHTWAVARLVAELTRSVLAIGELHLHLVYLFSLPFPASLRPLLRTMNVLHLRSTRPLAGRPWEPIRVAYVTKRLTDKRAQLEYYRRESARARRQLNLARRTFLLCSSAAFAAVLIKMFVVCDCLPLPHEPTAGLCGALAIVLPVLAVAALSLAAAFDLEARHHTFTEMLAFLQVQTRHLQAAASRREFAQLLLETESRLLGETVNWFSRRSFTGVA